MEFNKVSYSVISYSVTNAFQLALLGEIYCEACYEACESWMPCFFVSILSTNDWYYLSMAKVIRKFGYHT